MITPPRVNDLTLAEVNRAFRELARSCETEAKRVALGEWRLLEVLASEAASTFAFPATKRLYSVPPGGSVTTTRVRIFNTGETIIAHGLGRPPVGFAVLDQDTSGVLRRIDLKTLTGDYSDDRHIALSSAITGLYAVAVVG